MTVIIHNTSQQTQETQTPEFQTQPQQQCPRTATKITFTILITTEVQQLTTTTDVVRDTPHILVPLTIAKVEEVLG